MANGVECLFVIPITQLPTGEPMIVDPTMLITGIDECGRGCGAGPVVAAAVRFRVADLPGNILDRLDDSKRLTARKRSWLADQLRQHAELAVGAASVAEIDQINIRQATFLAMRRAHDRLGRAGTCMVDGNDRPPLPDPLTMVVGGDALVPQISAASIIAKVVRDTLMARLSERYSGYGWNRNAGYLTPEHREGIKAAGLTAHHRRTFRLVAA